MNFRHGSKLAVFEGIAIILMYTLFILYVYILYTFVNVILVKTSIYSLYDSLDPVYRKSPLVTEDIDFFLTHLKSLLYSLNEAESEENNKNTFIKFLYDTFYNNKHNINTKGRIDLALYDNGEPVVIFEFKKPGKNAGMVSQKNLNAKSFHQLIKYYFDERTLFKNTNIKYLIISNAFEWFVFDEKDFNDWFYNDSKLKKDYETCLQEKKKDDYFYAIVKDFLESSTLNFKFTYFNITESKTRAQIRLLYRFFSTQHLLKLPITNDNNILNTDFYDELLYIIGLEETKKNDKRIIQRMVPDKRQDASLIENCIYKLKTKNRLDKLYNPLIFGSTDEDRYFNVALELCITWINRVLFLKLLESQLIRYYPNNFKIQFLTFSVINDFDELSNLFFSVVAKKSSERENRFISKFEHVPYLNSTLFEENDLENDILGIESLDNNLELEVYTSTKLISNNKTQRGRLNTLDYLFRFLDSYNFASDGTDEEQKDRKKLINASVLGLIYEKINGYKDGSFFTPGFVTMYMCKVSIRTAIIQKFNETFHWECKNISDLYNHLNKNTEDILKYNKTVNEIRICDPAVGSGHFLVSSLNEILLVKSELGILADKNGKTLPINVRIINDELVIEEQNDRIFEYRKPSIDNLESENQRIQKTLFHEKEQIIENCLFGVDINGNSVKICRLRLWIELLKNTYFNEFGDLEILPNIDINIKKGNSLISKFTFHDDLSNSLKNSRKWNMKGYRISVSGYKQARNKQEKHAILNTINEIKSDFRAEINNKSKEVIALNKWNNDLIKLTTQTRLFDITQKEKKTFNDAVNKLAEKIKLQEKLIEEIKNSEIFKNAFEWRLEFPEILDDDGNFSGFDVVIGNPPYISAVEMARNDLYKKYFKERYEEAIGSYDIFILFLLLGLDILKPNGCYGWILPNKLLIADYAKKTLKTLQDNGLKSSIDVSMFPVFKGVGVYPIIIQGHKGANFTPKKLMIRSEDDMRTENFSQVKEIRAHKTLVDYGIKVMSGTTGFEAQKIKSFINENGKGIKFTVSGNIDPYCYNNESVRYMGSKFSKAFIYYDESIAKSKWEFWKNPKIVVAGMTKKIEAVYIDEPIGIGVGCYGIYNFGNTHPFALVAILNSKYMSYYLNVKFKDKHLAGGYLAINKSTIESLPFTTIDPLTESKLKNLSQNISLLKNLKNDTTSLENEVDEIVCDIFKLTEEEIYDIETNYKSISVH
jgi:adenine-specific DNA-methyltransferase